MQDTDTENRLVDTVGEGEREKNEESCINIHTMEHYLAIKRNEFKSVVVR